MTQFVLLFFLGCAALVNLPVGAARPAQPACEACADAKPDGDDSEPQSLLQSHTFRTFPLVSHDGQHAAQGKRQSSKVREDVPVMLEANSSSAASVASNTSSAASASKAPRRPLGGTAASGWALGALALLGAAAASLNDKTSEDLQEALTKCLAEFVGTFMLVFAVGCNVLISDPTWGIVSIACTLMVCIYALGGISGAHFNPAVTLALSLSGKVSLREMSLYIFTQLAAALLACIGYARLLDDTFNLMPAPGHQWWQAGLAETLYTFMLCFTVLNTAASKRHGGKDQFYGLAIGFSIVAGGYGAGSISGGCFNPAVALAVDASSISEGFGWFWAYLFFEVVGAFLAACLFRACRPDDFHDSPEEEPSMCSRLLSEFLGTYMLVLTVGLNVLAGSKAAVFSIAASLMVMIFALGTVSGAHFNPAVTMAILCSGRSKISVPDAGGYAVVQLAGGIAGAFTYVVMEGGQTVALRPSGGLFQAMMGELVFTFLLSYVVLSVATVESPLSQYFGLAIGSCVTAGGVAIGSLSGGALNPAVATGLAVSDVFNGGSLIPLLGYSAAELCGGTLAAVIFAGTHRSEYSKF